MVLVVVVENFNHAYLNHFQALQVWLSRLVLAVQVGRGLVLLLVEAGQHPPLNGHPPFSTKQGVALAEAHLDSPVQ
jgi:hypothetical protein